MFKCGVITETHNIVNPGVVDIYAAFDALSDRAFLEFAAIKYPQLKKDTWKKVKALHYWKKRLAQTDIFSMLATLMNEYGFPSENPSSNHQVSDEDLDGEEDDYDEEEDEEEWEEEYEEDFEEEEEDED